MEAMALLLVICLNLCVLVMSRGGRGQDSHNIGVIIHQNLEANEIAEIQDAINKGRKIINKHMPRANRWRYNIDTTFADMKNSYELLDNVTNMTRVRNISALVIIGPETYFHVIRSYIESEKSPNIPLFLPIAIGNTSCHDSKFHVNMMPSYVKAMVDIVDFYKWDTFYYIFDSDEGLYRLQDFYSSSSDSKTKRRTIRPRKILNVSDSYELLRSLDNIGQMEATPHNLPFIKRIILDLSSRTAYNKTLEQIIDVGMNRDSYHYLLGGLGIDELNLAQFKYGGVNITGFTIINRGSTTYKEIKRDYMNQANNERNIYNTLFPLKFKQALVIDTLKFIKRGIMKASHEGSDIISTLKTTVIPANESLSGTIEFDENGIRKNYELEVHQLELKTALRKVGSWTPSGANISQRFKTELPGPKDKPQPEQENKTYRIVSILDEPFIKWATFSESNKDNKLPIINGRRVEGYCIDVAEKVQKRYQKLFGKPFNYKIHLNDDYGSVNTSTGVWNGMVGELINGTADVAIASLTINKERERVVDFTKPFMKIGISIMIKKPDKQKPGVFSFMNPLSDYVWICVMIAFLAVSLVLFFVGRWSPFEWQTIGSTKQTSTNAFTFSNTLWFSLGALMQQGSDIFPRSFSGRIVGSAWWFFTLILISSYTANLAAFLTIERLLTPIKSADDLAHQTEIEYGTVVGGSTERFFKNSKVTVYEKMWAYMEANRERVMVAKNEIGIKKVRDSKHKYAFFCESPLNNYQSQKQPCNTMKVGENLDSKGYGIATPLYSPLRRNLNQVVLELREEGELHKLEQKWWYDKGECGAVDSKDSVKSPLTLSNVSGIFHILIGGLVLSMMVALLEYILHKHRKRQRLAKEKKQRSYKPTTVKIVKKDPLEVLKAAGYTEHENSGYTYSPPEQLTTFEGSPKKQEQTEI